MGILTHVTFLPACSISDAAIDAQSIEQATASNAFSLALSKRQQQQQQQIECTGAGNSYSCYSIMRIH